MKNLSCFNFNEIGKVFTETKKIGISVSTYVMKANGFRHALRNLNLKLGFWRWNLHRLYVTCVDLWKFSHFWNKIFICSKFLVLREKINRLSDCIGTYCVNKSPEWRKLFQENPLPQKILMRWVLASQIKKLFDWTYYNGPYGPSIWCTPLKSKS